MVFTMKRTITASPTQPHIAPMTMAVTSPAEVEHAGPRATGVYIPKKMEEWDDREKQALSLGGFQMRTDQRRAPSTTLQQIERKKWTRLQTSSDSAGSRLDPVWLPNHLAFDPQAFLFTHSQQRTIQTKDFSSVAVFPISASQLDLQGNNTVGVSWA